MQAERFVNEMHDLGVNPGQGDSLEALFADGTNLTGLDLAWTSEFRREENLERVYPFHVAGKWLPLRLLASFETIRQGRRLLASLPMLGPRSA
ncbi:MAG: hypothetical protein WD273_09810 [Trueperaceae bacterium]